MPFVVGVGLAEAAVDTGGGGVVVARVRLCRELGSLHAPPGHSEGNLHGLPRIGAEQATRSAADAGVAAARRAVGVFRADFASTLLQVSHWHRRPAYPMPRQRGWAAVTVRVWLSVLRFRSMVSTPIELPDGGQSRLTSPSAPSLAPCTVGRRAGRCGRCRAAGRTGSGGCCRRRRRSTRA